MKASVKLRDAEGHGPLLRAKLPISALGLPLVSSASVGGGPGDHSLQLRTAFPWGPSLALSYNPLTQPFSISIKSGLGRCGSPLASPLLLSARLSLSPNSSSAAAVSFSLQLKPSLGHFSLKKSAASPKPGSDKEDGGGAGLEEFLTSGVAVAVRSTMPVGRRAAVRLRWGANVPPRGAAVAGRRLPYLTVEKISVEYVGNGGDEGSQKTGRERGEVDAEEVNGLLHSMVREVEELQKDDSAIKENVELLGKKARNGRDRRIEGSGAKLEGIGSRGIKQDAWKGVGGSGRYTC